MYGFDALPDGKGAELYMPLNNVPISELTDYLPEQSSDTSDVEPADGGFVKPSMGNPPSTARAQ